MQLNAEAVLYCTNCVINNVHMIVYEVVYRV